jgi:AraC-like DNA-binding protein
MDPRIRILLKIVEEQKGAIRLTLRNTSGLLGVSEARLLRLFKQEIGMTFRRYLRRARMDAAAELLKTHTLSIKEIALASGYEDVSNFYRDFRDVHEMSPRQWQLEHLVLCESPKLLRVHEALFLIGRADAESRSRSALIDDAPRGLPGSRSPCALKDQEQSGKTPRVDTSHLAVR